MALTQSVPEVDCSVFDSEEVHPTKALISKEDLRDKFYQANAVCISCRNCLEETCKE
ncbi:MAG: hypothetical protein PVJ67_06890 [Candidatus Pacearchaeota archaeon]|jgi:hypothetical protein